MTNSRFLDQPKAYGEPSCAFGTEPTGWAIPAKTTGKPPKTQNGWVAQSKNCTIRVPLAVPVPMWDQLH